MKLPDKVYDWLKYICLIILPAAAAAFAACGSLWGLPDETIKIVTGTITGIATAIGATVGFSSANYYKDESEKEPEPEKEPVATIFLSPSQQAGNKYAVGDTNEKEQCEKIAEACAQALRLHGFEVILDPTVPVEKRVIQAQDIRPDWYIPIHTNAFDGTVSGTRMFVRSFKNEEELEMCQAVYSWLDGCCPGKSSNIKEVAKLYEFYMIPDIKAIYCECDFHDNKEAAAFIITHQKEIGESIARGICEYYDIEW